MNMTPTFVYPIFDIATTTTCPGCGLGTKLREHNFVVVPRFTIRVLSSLKVMLNLWPPKNTINIQENAKNVPRGYTCTIFVFFMPLDYCTDSCTTYPFLS